MTKPETIRGVLLDGHKGAAVEVTFDPSVRWSRSPAPLWKGRRGHRVTAKLKSVTFDSAIVARSKRFWLLVDAQTMKSAGVSVGDTVQLQVSPSTP